MAGAGVDKGIATGFVGSGRQARIENVSTDIYPSSRSLSGLASCVWSLLGDYGSAGMWDAIGHRRDIDSKRDFDIHPRDSEGRTPEPSREAGRCP